LRNIGIAIAARMPMMMITIRSSMSVNPNCPAVGALLAPVAAFITRLRSVGGLSSSRHPPPK